MDSTRDHGARTNQEQQSKEFTKIIPKAFHNRQRLYYQQTTQRPEFGYAAQVPQQWATVHVATQDGRTDTPRKGPKRTKGRVFSATPNRTENT